MDKLALLGSTKAKILRLLLENKRTAKDVADSLHIQVSAVRKHLESLKESGFVETSSVNQGVGRPKKFFALSRNGRELYPTQYSTLLTMIISKLIREKETWHIEQLMEEIAEEIGHKVRSETGSAINSNEALDRLVGNLNEYGFETSIDAIAEGLSISSRNCPMMNVASKYQNLICNHFHGRILTSALDVSNVELKDCMAMGAGICTHIVPVQGK